MSPYGKPFAPRIDHLHAGTDIYAPQGTKVYASISGEVIWSGDTFGAYGGAVITKSEFCGESIYAIYAHLGKTTDVKKGGGVKAGGILGSLAPHKAGSHLHIEFLTNLEEITVSEKETGALERGINKKGNKFVPIGVDREEENGSNSRYFSIIGKINRMEARTYVIINPFGWKPVNEGEVYFPIQTTRYEQTPFKLPGKANSSTKANQADPESKP